MAVVAAVAAGLLLRSHFFLSLSRSLSLSRFLPPFSLALSRYLTLSLRSYARADTAVIINYRPM